ncbi:hypothetical protein KKHLCK_09595 [Candidatus Electrothrix laxa]
MLSVKNYIHIGLFMAILSYTALINQVIAAISIDLPVSATADPLAAPIATIVASQELADMRDNVAIATVDAQSLVTFDADGVQTSEMLPMQGEMETMIQGILMPSIKSQIMTSLASPSNADGAVYLFAPDFLTYELVNSN